MRTDILGGVDPKNAELLGLAFDEVAAVHERLQFWTGTFGQLSLVPVLAVGGLAGLAGWLAFPVWPLALVRRVRVRPGAVAA